MKQTIDVEKFLELARTARDQGWEYVLVLSLAPSGSALQLTAATIVKGDTARKLDYYVAAEQLAFSNFDIVAETQSKMQEVLRDQID